MMEMLAKFSPVLAFNKRQNFSRELEVLDHAVGDGVVGAI